MQPYWEPRLLPFCNHYCVQYDLDSSSVVDGFLEHRFVGAEVAEDAGRVHDHLLRRVGQELEQVSDQAVVARLRKKCTTDWTSSVSSWIRENTANGISTIPPGTVENVPHGFDSALTKSASASERFLIVER